MAKKKSRSNWIQQHLDDPYVKKAQIDGYRSRASYKLLEIDDKYNLIKPGMTIVDLGAAPGGWSQVARERMGESGKITALDLLPMDPIEDVRFIQGDFEDIEVLEMLSQALDPGSPVPGSIATGSIATRSLEGSRPLDLVISDMAPNLSGMKAVDQPKAVYLTELALEFADNLLKEGGSLVTKCFEGEGIDAVRKAFRDKFEKVINFKPKASRDKSREIYLIGQYYVK